MMENISKIIGYKIKPIYNTPQEHLDGLINWWNSFLFQQAKEQTFREMDICKKQINELIKRYPELGPVNLKNYYW